MLILCCLLVALNFAGLFLLTRNHTNAERAWTQERRELLSRIQHPERVPALPGETFVVPDPEPDELNLVGTINYDVEGKDG